MAALVVCTLAGGCRTRLVAPTIEGVEPHVIECSDPVIVTVKLDVPIRQVATGDFNGDGSPDLVGISRGINITHGHGDGTFGPPIPSAVRLGDVFAAVADFDRNGVDDVVTTRAGHSMEIFKGLPRTDQVQNTPVVSGYAPAATGIGGGDLDGDGVPDVAVLDDGGLTLSLLFGRDGSDFTTPFALPLPIRSTWGFVGIADIDGDHHGDLLFPADSAIYAIRAVTRRSASSPDRLVDLPPGPAGPLHATALAWADWNGDGHLDLAATAPERAGDNVFVALGAGNGTFAAPLALRAGLAPDNPVAVDWNLDGHMDLAVANSGTDHSVTFLYGRGDGTFADPQVCQAVTFEATGGPNWVTSADFDHDGRPDLAFAYYDGLDVVLNHLR